MIDADKTPAEPPAEQALPPRDPRSLALLLIDRFGERAGSYATHQALKALSRGNEREAARWRWIAEITRSRRSIE
jgi:hypothetical protein